MYMRICEFMGERRNKEKKEFLRSLGWLHEGKEFNMIWSGNSIISQTMRVGN